MNKQSGSHFLSGLRSNVLIGGLFAILVVSVVLLFVNFAYINTQSNYDKSTSLKLVSCAYCRKRIAKNATEAAAGKAAAFAC